MPKRRETAKPETLQETFMTDTTDMWPQWLKEADTSDARVEIENGVVIWCGGVWHGGTWYGDEWLRGEWHEGTWCGGTWRGGKWNGGEWRGGTRRLVGESGSLTGDFYD